MASGRKPGPVCSHRDEPNINDGTSYLQESPKPGPLGLSPRSSSVGNWFSQTGEEVLGHSKSLLISLLDLLPFKQNSPFSTALLKHYVEGSGDDYPRASIGEIPREWQDWIVKSTGGRPGMHYELDPYNSGLFDLRNSLGHFDVEVKANNDNTKTYVIADDYRFGFIRNDNTQRGRHGFGLGHLSDWQISAAKSLLPSREYMNPGGFKERWEIKVGRETILFIPQQYLVQQGKSFRVSGSFTR